MMPGVAIRPDFPIAAAPAGRIAVAKAGDGFSKALHERPNAPAGTDGKAEQPAKSGAGDDGSDIGAPSAAGKNDKAGRAFHARDGGDGNADDGAKKDPDGKEDGALPPQLTAQRVLAAQWPAATQAAARGGTAAEPSAGAGAGASSPQGVPTVQANAGPAVPGQRIIDMTGMAAAAPGGGAAIRPAVPAAMPAPATATQTGKDAPAPTPATADTDPTPAGVAVSSTATVEAASPSAAFMAKVAALDHGAKSANAPQGAASAPVSGGNAAQAKLPQALSGQGPGNGGADPDSQRSGNGGAQDKAAKGMAPSSAVASGDSSAAPLPTAQMIPSSGGASSFAVALADGGRLARYVANASTAAANGVPAAALPVQSLRIQLQPVALGTVTANLKYAGGLLSIDIEVQNPDAQRRLSSDSTDIVKSLQSLGFQVDKLTVRQAQAQTQTQSQPQGQATAQDGSAGRFGGQGGNPFSASGHPERQASQHRQGSESGNEDASERGIGAIRPAADRHQPRRGVFI